MKSKKVSFLLSRGLAVVVISVLLASCTCKIKDDQLAKLAELRRQEKSLNTEIADKQSAKSRIDRELQTVNSDYDNCNGRRDLVKDRLSRWPNVWPDWTPEQPQP